MSPMKCLWKEEKGKRASPMKINGSGSKRRAIDAFSFRDCFETSRAASTTDSALCRLHHAPPFLHVSACSDFMSELSPSCRLNPSPISLSLVPFPGSLFLQRRSFILSEMSCCWTIFFFPHPPCLLFLSEAGLPSDTNVFSPSSVDKVN